MPGFLQSALWITNAHGQNRELLTFVAQLRGQPNQSGTKPQKISRRIQNLSPRVLDNYKL